MTSQEKPAPKPEDYLHALQQIREWREPLIKMLRHHYFAANRTVAADELAAAFKYTHRSVANAFYGHLGRQIGELLDFDPGSVRLDSIILTTKPKGRWLWTLRPEFAAALKMIGWVDSPEVLMPEEVVTKKEFKEGKTIQVMVNAYERNPEARRICLETYGTNCCICDFSFVKTYGEIGEGFIHVHHLKPLSEINSEYHVDPIADLRPVCPNCHAMLHKRIPAYSISEIQSLLKQPK